MSRIVPSNQHDRIVRLLDGQDPDGRTIVAIRDHDERSDRIHFDDIVDRVLAKVGDGHATVLARLLDWNFVDRQ